MAVSYDAQVIQSFADQLYKQAARIVATYAIRGFLLAGPLAGFAAAVSGRSSIVPALVAGLIGAFIGASMGQGKANALRLQAQTALCQVQIETNTKLSARQVRHALSD